MIGLDNAEFIARKIIKKKLSVRQTENLVRIFKVKRRPLTVAKDANLKALELSITEKLGLNVSIKNKKNNSGTLTFEFKDLNQLNKIIEIIKSNY